MTTSYHNIPDYLLIKYFTDTNLCSLELDNRIPDFILYPEPKYDGYGDYIIDELVGYTQGGKPIMV